MEKKEKKEKERKKKKQRLFWSFRILELQNRVTQNHVTPRVTNSKMFIEILLSNY